MDRICGPKTQINTAPVKVATSQGSLEMQPRLLDRKSPSRSWAFSLAANAATTFVYALYSILSQLATKHTARLSRDKRILCHDWCI
jgi:hypothetical protein